MNVHQRAPRLHTGDHGHSAEASVDISPDAATPRSPAYAISSASAQSASHLRPSSYRSRESFEKDVKKPSLRSALTQSRIIAIMIFSALFLFVFLVLGNGPVSAQNRRQADARMQSYRRAACPDYTTYSARKHAPFTNGKYRLPFQRPAEDCRKFNSTAVEKVIKSITSKLKDPDLARLFENAYPNTLDTTVAWHTPKDANGIPQSFIITGDITAQWLRDSANQVKGYQMLANEDAALKNLLKGAINTQVGFVLQSPYCNAFQPPAASGLAPTSNGQSDTVHPTYDPDVVFECKYELDSIASFLDIATTYYANTGDTSFVTAQYMQAIDNVMTLLEEQSVSTFAPDGSVNDPTYTFQRETNVGTETLNLAGRGNPLNSNTSLVRSAFRPSDDATIFQYFIPANAFMSVQLGRAADMLQKAKQPKVAAQLRAKGEAMRAGIMEHGIVNHSKFGQVFAFEVDGYGSQNIMDDANLPSLLALPLLGFVDVNDPIYQNTRRLVLSAQGNPYFLNGTDFMGIGGPHVGIQNAWPMSLMVQIQTTDDDAEIVKLLQLVLKASPFGLINESVNVNMLSDFTRSWFAWANSVYAETIMDLAKRKPQLLFGLDFATGSTKKGRDAKTSSTKG